MPFLCPHCGDPLDHQGLMVPRLLPLCRHTLCTKCAIDAVPENKCPLCSSALAPPGAYLTPPEAFVGRSLPQYLPLVGMIEDLARESPLLSSLHLSTKDAAFAITGIYDVCNYECTYEATMTVGGVEQPVLIRSLAPSLRDIHEAAEGYRAELFRIAFASLKLERIAPVHGVLELELPETASTPSPVLVFKRPRKPLKQAMREAGTFLTDLSALRLSADLFRCLASLHVLGLPHGDIRPETVWVQGDGATFLLSPPAVSKRFQLSLSLLGEVLRPVSVLFQSPEEILEPPLQAPDMLGLGSPSLNPRSPLNLSNLDSSIGSQALLDTSATLSEGEFDPRSTLSAPLQADIWSAALVARYARSNELPWPEVHKYAPPLQRGQLQVKIKHARSEPLLPKLRSAKPSLLAIIDAALVRDPQARPPAHRLLDQASRAALECRSGNATAEALTSVVLTVNNNRKILLKVPGSMTCGEAVRLELSRENRFPFNVEMATAEGEFLSGDEKVEQLPVPVISVQLVGEGQPEPSTPYADSVDVVVVPYDAVLKPVDRAIEESICRFTVPRTRGFTARMLKTIVLDRLQSDEPPPGLKESAARFLRQHGSYNALALHPIEFPQPATSSSSSQPAPSSPGPRSPGSTRTGGLLRPFAPASTSAAPPPPKGPPPLVSPEPLRDYSILKLEFMIARTDDSPPDPSTPPLVFCVLDRLASDCLEPVEVTARILTSGDANVSSFEEWTALQLGPNLPVLYSLERSHPIRTAARLREGETLPLSSAAAQELRHEVVEADFRLKVADVELAKTSPLSVVLADNTKSLRWVRDPDPRGPSRTVVRLLSGVELALDLCRDDTIGVLKIWVQMLLGLPVAAQKLLRAGREAEDSELVATPESVGTPERPVYVYLLLKLSGGMQVKVKGSHGRVVPVETRFDETVLSLKGKIEAKEGTPIALQKLFFNGVLMEDHRTLGDYGITQGHQIALTLKLRGT